MLKSEGLKSVIWMSVGNVGATVLSALAMIIFSRALGPINFGIFSVLFSLLLILSRVGDLGLNISIQRHIAQNKGNQKLINKFIRVGSSLKLILTALIFLAGIVSSGLITTSILALPPENTVYVLLVFCFSLGVIFYEYITAVLQAIQSFSFSILCNWVQSSTKLVLAFISLIFHELSLLVITILYLFAPVLGGIVGFAKIPLTAFMPLWDKNIVSKIISVSRWTGIAIIAATAADNLDIIIVQNFLSSYDTGLYSAATKIASVASLFSFSLGTVLNVRVASYKDPANLRSYIKKATLLSLLSFVAISSLSIISHPAISLTVGSEFIGAASTLKILLVGTAILTATSPFVALFYLIDQPVYFALSGIIGTVLLVSGDLMLIPQHGLIGAAYARLIMRAVVLLFTLWYAKISFQKHYSR